MIAVTRYDSHLSTDGTYDEVTWDELRALLFDVREAPCDPCPALNPDGTKHRCPEKHGKAWSPVRLSGTRKLVNVREVSALVIDLDHLRTSDYRRALEALKPYRYLLHSTHSHRPPEDRCFRAVVALSRPVKGEEWPAFFAAATAKLGVKFDPAAKDASRLFFLPSAPPSRIASFKALEGDGEVLDVDQVLAEAPAAAPPPAVPQLPVDQPSPVSLTFEDYVDALKSLRRKARAGKDELLATMFDNAINGRELVPAGEGQEPALHRVASALAYKLPPGTDADEAITFALRPSIVAMGAGPEGLDHWFKKAKISFTKSAERRNAADAVRAAHDAQFATALRRLFEAKAPTPAPEDPEPEPDEVSWREQLILVPGTKAVELRSCGANVSTILQHSPDWKGKVRFDSLRGEIILDPDTPLGLITEQNTLGRKLANYLERAWGLFAGEAVVFSCLLEVARGQSFDPLQDMLVDCTWDGVERLDTMLERALGARTVNADGEDITGHVRRVSRRFMIGAAVRALSPGEQVDTVLVLEGGQGGGKTSFLRMLGGPFYANGPRSLEGADAMQLAATSWIIELAELASFRKADADVQKAFFTVTVDKFRPPYGRTHETYPRRCVFAGTVNPEEGAGYFTDRTGNRRYWPVVVGELDRAWFRTHRSLLLGEAVHFAREALRVRDEHGSENVPARLRWWNDQSEETVAAAEAKTRVRTSPTTDLVYDWLVAMAPDKRPTFVRTRDVAREALGLTADRIDRRAEMEVGASLRELGFEKKRVRDGGHLDVHYLTPTSIIEARQVARGKAAAFSLIAGGKP